MFTFDIQNFKAATAMHLHILETPVSIHSRSCSCDYSHSMLNRACGNLTIIIQVIE